MSSQSTNFAALIAQSMRVATPRAPMKRILMSRAVYDHEWHFYSAMRCIMREIRAMDPGTHYAHRTPGCRDLTNAHDDALMSLLDRRAGWKIIPPFQVILVSPSPSAGFARFFSDALASGYLPVVVMSPDDRLAPSDLCRVDGYFMADGDQMAQVFGPPRSGRLAEPARGTALPACLQAPDWGLTHEHFQTSAD